jgi:protocatechuate 3,4-dioxygenase beta subunit
MKRHTSTLGLLMFLAACGQTQVQDQDQPLVKPVSQNLQVGGPCEGCEGAEEYGDRQLSWIDTLEDFTGSGPRIEVSGTVFQKDGKTPARDVIVYVYHTDQTGVYPKRGDEKGWGRRHGYLRTWLKTNDKGQYKFYTLRPGSYPNSRNPAHIHTTIKEPGKPPYWIDDFLFDDDPFLTERERSNIDGRGGKTGILKDAKLSGSVTTYKRDIILGLNVPGYY